MRRSLALSGALLLGACPSAFQAHDPESEVRRRLDQVAFGGVTWSIADRELRFPQLTLSEIAVRTAPLQAMFHVVATGSYGPSEPGYYGSESLTLQSPSELAFRLPRLQGVLEALATRARVLREHDPAALVKLTTTDYRDGAITPKDLPGLLSQAAPEPEPRAISVRVDGDWAQVTLSLGADGGSPHALSLVQLGDSWRFSSGLL